MSSVEVGTSNASFRSTIPALSLASGNTNFSGVKTATEGSQNSEKSDTENAQRANSVDPAALGEAVESINQFVNAQMRTLNFSVDEGSGKAVVKVVDFDSGDVIRQIPGEEVLRMASAIKKLQDDLGSATGLLINSQV